MLILTKAHRSCGSAVVNYKTCCSILSRTFKNVLCKDRHHQNLLSNICKRTFRTTSQFQGDDVYQYRSYNNLKEDNEEKFKEWIQTGNHPIRKKLSLYSKLSKARLTALVTLSATAGYVIAPGPFSALAFGGVCLGTFLCSSSANSFNQFVEVPYDCQMARTKDRVLVRGMLRPLEAVNFGIVSGLLGFSILATTVNMPTAYLGLANIVLYAGIYTPSKRMHIANTWIGAVVGGIPPIMGWLACTGGLDIGAFILAGMLYSWQFPHFNALSWNYRPDYSRAGYRMMSVTDPALCRRVTLRHGLAQIPLSIAACLFHVTNWSYLVISLPCNIYLALLSWEFYKNSNNNTARKLFRCTLWHLPVLMFFAAICRYKEEGSIPDALNILNAILGK